MNDNHKPPIAELLDPGNIVGNYLEAVVELDRLWGNARFGMVLCVAHFSATAFTTNQLANMCLVSPETVRRWLKPLINVDRVAMIREGRNVRYKAEPFWATRTRDLLYNCRDKVNMNLRDTSNDNNMGSFITVRRMLTLSERKEASAS